MLKSVKNHWQLIIIEGLILVAFCVFYGRFGDIIIDSFRESYIPQQILSGKILYKNIFCIYPPFAYLFNAFLYKIFGINLNVLYFSGLITTMGIFFFVYKLSKMFLNNFLTFAVCILTFSGLVLSPNVFNPFFPYSYGLLYGLLFILGSVYFALNKKFPVAYSLYALAICSKPEFLLFLPVLMCLSDKKDILKNLIALILPIASTLSVLLLTGVTFSDLKTAFDLINTIAHTQTLHWFYTSMGLVFRWELIPIYAENIIKFLIPFKFNLYQEIFIWIYPVITILFAIRFKNLSKEEKIFVISGLLISIKVFFALTLQSYGVFFIPFALISFLILIPKKAIKYMGFLILIWAVIIGVKNSQSLLNKNIPINSDNGTVKISKNYAEDIKNVINYTNNLPQNTKIAVFPECLAINFLTGKNSDDKFYSLIPLYVETFGEDVIIKRLELYPPEYILINNYNTSAYYFMKFGNDYARKVYDRIKETYNLKTTIGTNLRFEVYQKN